MEAMGRDYLALVIQVLMAALGALARIFNQKEPTHLRYVMSQMFVAGFTGALIYWLQDMLNLGDGLMFALAGIAGYVGPMALDSLTALVFKRTGLQPPSSSSNISAPPSSDGADNEG
jgi:hypothetical protein